MSPELPPAAKLPAPLVNPCSIYESAPVRAGLTVTGTVVTLPHPTIGALLHIGGIATTSALSFVYQYRTVTVVSATVVVPVFTILRCGLIHLSIAVSPPS